MYFRIVLAWIQCHIFQLSDPKPHSIIGSSLVLERKTRGSTLVHTLQCIRSDGAHTESSTGMEVMLNDASDVARWLMLLLLILMFCST